MADGHAKIDPQETVEGYLKRRFSFDEFWKLWADGTLEAGDESLRFELWEGDIRMVPPPGGKHSLASGRLQRALGDELACHDPDRTFLLVGVGGMRLSKDDYRSPDIMVVRPDRSLTDEPIDAAGVELVIETADSSLRGDLTFKRDKYAEAGIPEYWVQDVENQRLHAFRDPASGAFTEHLRLEGEATVSPLFEPRITLRVGDLF